MSRFPGYKSERELKKLRQEEERTHAQEERHERDHDSYRAFELVRDSLPTLIDHCQSEAMPAETPTMIPGYHVVRPAWIIKRFMSAPGSSDGPGQEAVEQLWAITENGKCGMATRVKRGVPALKFFGRPTRLCPRTFQGGSTLPSNTTQTQLVTSQLEKLLRAVGLSLSDKT